MPYVGAAGAPASSGVTGQVASIFYSLLEAAIGARRLGGTPGKAQLATVAFFGLAALLVIGMFAAHVPQNRL